MNYQCRCRCAAANRHTARLPAEMNRQNLVLTSQSSSWKGRSAHDLEHVWQPPTGTGLRWVPPTHEIISVSFFHLLLITENDNKLFCYGSRHGQMAIILCGRFVVFSHWWKVISFTHLETPAFTSGSGKMHSWGEVGGGGLRSFQGLGRGFSHARGSTKDFLPLLTTGEYAAKAVMLFYNWAWLAAPKCWVSWFNLHLQKISVCFLLPGSLKHRILDFEPPTMILETFFVKVKHEPWGMCRLLQPSLSH